MTTSTPFQRLSQGKDKFSLKQHLISFTKSINRHTNHLVGVRIKVSIRSKTIYQKLKFPMKTVGVLLITTNKSFDIEIFAGETSSSFNYRLLLTIYPGKVKWVLDVRKTSLPMSEHLLLFLFKHSTIFFT